MIRHGLRRQRRVRPQDRVALPCVRPLRRELVADLALQILRL